MTTAGGSERILAVAIESFSQLGYEGTTTAAIARAAGVTQPLVHHHFGSKEGLWRAAMDGLFADVPAFTPADDGTPVELLLRTVEWFVRFTAERPQATRVIAREGGTASRRLAWLVDRHLRAPMQSVVTAIRTGQRAGSIARDVQPELLLFLILGAVSHLFDVGAFVRESTGVDVTTRATREAFVQLVRTTLLEGVLRA